MPEKFEYDNLIGRPGGRYLRLGAKVHRGIRSVQQQIVPYAADWKARNTSELAAVDLPLWVVLGDSMGQGIGAKSHDRGWVGQLRERMSVGGQEYRLINLSISGARIADVLERQLPAMETLGTHPDLVTVMVGSNDLVRRKYRKNALADFDTLLERLPTGAFVANLLGGHDAPVAIDRRLQEAVAANKLHMVDIRRKGPRTWRGMVAEDFFHPNEAGYREIARIFSEALSV